MYIDHAPLLDETRPTTGTPLMSSTSIPNAKVAEMRAGGFIPRYPLVHSVYNRMIGIALLVVTLPVLTLLALIVLLVQGRPVFYGGDRLGKNRQVFQIYKFRTLDTALAKVLTADKVLPRNANIESRMGKFLRASRLDELPQLLNVALGDMNLVGPRPVRDEIAKRQLLDNPHYDIRFRIKPGMIGPTQAYSCHGTSKRIRARLNYDLCNRRVSYLRDIGLLISVGTAVLTTTARLLHKRITNGKNIDGMWQRAETWSLCLELADGRIVPIRAFHDHKMMIDQHVADGDCQLLIHCQSGLRRARVTIANTGQFEDRLTHAITPANDVAEHLISRYLMGEAVVAPRRPKATSRAPEKTKHQSFAPSAHRDFTGPAE